MTIFDELTATVEKYRRLGKINYWVAFFCYFVAVSSSILSTILAIGGGVGTNFLAALSAMPGAMVVIASTFKFSERASWHYEKKNHLNALRRLVLAEGESVSAAEVAKRWNSIDLEMEPSWPKFGGISMRPNGLRGE